MRTPRRITIQLETHNAAFDDCDRGEIARILRHAARSIADDSIQTHGGALLDINGNTCGHIVIESLQ